MTDARVTPLYVFAVTLLVFFVVWAVVAAHPWVAGSSGNRQIAALAAREQRSTSRASSSASSVRSVPPGSPSQLPLPRGRRASSRCRARDHEDVLIQWHAFRAMGTDVELLVRPSNGAAREAFEAVEAEFERLEQIMSRSVPTLSSCG